MRIAIDGQVSSIQKSGFGNYVDNLTKHVAKIDQTIEFKFISPNEGSDLSTPKRIIWDQLGFPSKARKIKPDLIHKPCFSAPIYSGIKTVVTVHDLIPLLYPENFSKTSRFFYNKLMPFSFHFVDHFITISEQSKKDMMRLLKIKEDKISVILESAGEAFKPLRTRKDLETIDGINKKYNISSKYILCVGTLEPRKNLEFLVTAFSEALKKKPESKYQLVITGKKGWFYEKLFSLVEKLKLAQKVVFTGYVEEADLPYLYNGADFFAFPSIYEGFGLPPLEAMACGIPVICSNSSSLPEVCGDAAILLPPDNIDLWSETISRLIDNAEELEKLSERSLSQAKKFSWDKTAEKTIKVYEGILNKKSRLERTS